MFAMVVTILRVYNIGLGLQILGLFRPMVSLFHTIQVSSMGPFGSRDTTPFHQSFRVPSALTSILPKLDKPDDGDIKDLSALPPIRGLY
jgi:hypothetical protein